MPGAIHSTTSFGEKRNNYEKASETINYHNISYWILLLRQPLVISKSFRHRVVHRFPLGQCPGRHQADRHHHIERPLGQSEIRPAPRYNQAIISFSQAAEFAGQVDDQNLLGILYSIMADTFTKTRDHSMAHSYIEKSLDCFRLCGREDQERLVRLREAGNYSQTRMWSKEDSCFRTLLSDQ